MVPPNAAAKQSGAKAAYNNGVDLGQKLAKRKSQDFKSKIAGWNDQPPPAPEPQPQPDDVIVVEVEEESEKHEDGELVEKKHAAQTEQSIFKLPEAPNIVPIATQPERESPPSRKISRSIDVERKAWVRRKPKPVPKASPEVKEAATPKKRIVSDGHWRRDRVVVNKDPTPEQEVKEKDITPKPIIIRRSVVSVGLKVPPSVQDFVEPDLKPKRVQPLTRRARSRSRSSGEEHRAPAASFESSGFKVYINRKDKPRTVEATTKHRKAFSASESSFTAASFDRHSSATELTIPDTLFANERQSREPTRYPKRRTVKRSVSADAKPKASPSHRVRNEDGDALPGSDGSANLKGASENEPRKEPKERQPPRPVPRVFGNRVQGWLNTMPDDPFTEQSAAYPPSEPSDVRRRKSRITRRSFEELRNVDGSRRYNDDRRRSRPTPGRPETDEGVNSRQSPTGEHSDASSAHTPTLKRSGARRGAVSPVKRRGAQDHDSMYRMAGALPVLPLMDSKRYVTAPGPAHQNNGQDAASSIHKSSVAANSRDNALATSDGKYSSRASDGDVPNPSATRLKRRLTKHSDLMSVLSNPREDEAVMNLNRSSKSRRIRPEKSTTAELMNELTTDELKYQRELRTLVDGVIPVLLNYTIRTDPQKSSGSTQSATRSNSARTQPVVNMGVALERLKASHKRIPMHNPQELLTWAEDTASLYADYLRVWRLGFHELVVNLAPVESKEEIATQEKGVEHGHRGNASAKEGERVDVAYLLKRPLVRLKTLRKTLHGIAEIEPSPLAREIEALYGQLVNDARQRASDERARLEDEAAATIDPTRARDVQSLAPLSGVNIDATRNVRARDYFDMQLYHSSGQQLDCKIEIILRDDAPGRGNLSDLLFCEVSAAGRWLLFPPLPLHLVSSRNGDRDLETVVMIQGRTASGSPWRELMLLRSTAEQSGEWIRMLGSDPLPPRLTRQSSFNAYGENIVARPALTAGTLSEDLHLPIGERAKDTAQIWDGSEVNSVAGYSSPRPGRGRASLQPVYSTDASSAQSAQTQPYGDYDDREVGGRRRRAADEMRPIIRRRSKSEYSSYSTSTTSKDYTVWMPPNDNAHSDEDDTEVKEEVTLGQKRPPMHRRTSSVPSNDLPNIQKRRGIPDVSISSTEHQHARNNSTPVGRTYAEPRSAPARYHRPYRGNQDSPVQQTQNLSLEKPRGHTTHQTGTAIPQLTPSSRQHHRRSSSPLKYEYDPSMDTSSSSDSHHYDSDSELSITSESSADEDIDHISTLGDLKGFTNFGTKRLNGRFSPPSQRHSPPNDDNDTLGPSESISQAPFRKVPRISGQATSKTVASIFCWTDNGAWESLHPQECEIVVTPGLIEAFDIAQAQQVSPNCEDPTEPSPSLRGVKPLVALELTPLVPLRRGTALDISVRSPPTANSLLRTGNNIMFRSRSTEECEKLYGFINRARIDNPTWIALQNARGPLPTSNWAEVMDKRSAARSSGVSWLKSLSRKSSTYRSTGTRALSTAATESSVGTSAFSALRIFSGGSSRFFNIAKSTLMSRDANTRSTGSDSLDSGAATPHHIDLSMGTPVGVTRAKIRLWQRESASKWRDLGSARLTVIIPRRVDSAGGARPPSPQTEKRILITGKSDRDILLDVTLPESSFERVARTGIALSLIEEAGQIQSTGGVLTATAKVFMLQMKSEREAAYTFSMVGKLRY